MLDATAVTLSSTAFGWDHGHMNMGWTPMIIFWALFVALIVWILRAARRSDDERESPSQILDRRLANGTLTREEFEQRRSMIDRDDALRNPGKGVLK